MNFQTFKNLNNLHFMHDENSIEWNADAENGNIFRRQYIVWNRRQFIKIYIEQFSWLMLMLYIQTDDIDFPPIACILSQCPNISFMMMFIETKPSGKWLSTMDIAVIIYSHGKFIFSFAVCSALTPSHAFFLILFSVSAVQSRIKPNNWIEYQNRIKVAVIVIELSEQ